MYPARIQGPSAARPLQRERVGRLLLLYQFDLKARKLYLRLNEAKGLQLASDAEAKGQHGRLAFIRISVLPTAEADVQSVSRVLFKPSEGKKSNPKSMRARTVLHRLHENIELNEVCHTPFDSPQQGMRSAADPLAVLSAALAWDLLRRKPSHIPHLASLATHSPVPSPCTTPGV